MMNGTQSETLRMLARSIDPVEFCRQFFEPDPWQQDVLTSTENQVILNCSRMSGKSSISAVLALFHAMNNAGSLILCVSPSLRQSGELLKKIVNHYHELGRPLGATIDSATALQLSNRSRIVSLPATEKTIRGYSADLICVDEAARCPEELYIAIRPMRALGGRLILLSTPAGKRGTFFREWTEGVGWLKIEVKATECHRISKQFLESEKRALGERWWRQEYACEFFDSDYSVFEHDLIMASLGDFAEWDLGDLDADVDAEDLELNRLKEEELTLEEDVRKQEAERIRIKRLAAWDLG